MLAFVAWIGLVLFFSLSIVPIWTCASYKLRYVDVSMYVATVRSGH